MKSKLSIGIVALLVVAAAVIFVFDRVPDEMSHTERDVLVEEYIRENISDLSPESEVLGGTFYVTHISFIGESTGEVFYEDGHIALVADFVYDIGRDGTTEVVLSDVRDAVE